MLAHIAPSAIALVAYATPTPAFAEEFTRLLHTPAARDIRLRWPRRRFLGYTEFPAKKLRAEEVRQRLLTANKEVTLLFRSYFHAGLSQRGPLPSIEAFTVSQSREWLSRVMTLDAPGTHWDLLSILGADPGHALYETDTYVLYATSVQHGRYEFRNLQLLTTETIREKGSAAPDQHLEIFDDAWHVSPLLAFDHAYSHAINDVLQARDRLSTAISAFHVRRIAWHISHSLRLGVLQFRLRLLRAELGKTSDRSFLHSFTEHIRRKEHWGSPPATLGDDLWSALQDKQDLLERQLDVVRTTHQEVTALKSLRVGYRLQRIAILLTAAAVFRTEIHDAIKAVLLRILSFVGG
jgi:hypothetical protein